MADVQRWASLATAAAVMAYGAYRAYGPGQRRGKPLWIAAATATPFAFRSLTGDWPHVTRSVSRARASTQHKLGGIRGMRVHEAVRLELPLGNVYRFWRNLENLPRFMRHLVEVTPLEGGRSRWTARGPAGVTVSWQAEIINEIPNKLIAWRSLPGSDIVTAGSVNFAEVRGGRSTQVTVRLQYSPPAGKAGAYLAMLFGREPSQTIREDLRRLKQLLEAGEPAQTPAQRA